MNNIKMVFIEWRKKIFQFFHYCYRVLFHPRAYTCYKSKFFYIFILQLIITVNPFSAFSIDWKTFVEHPPVSEMQKLEGGLTNSTYKYNVGNKSFAIRIGSPDTERLNINREQELFFHNIGILSGIAPKIYYSDPNKGILVCEFIHGKPLKSSDLNNKDILKKIVNIAKELHLNKKSEKQKLATFYFSSIKNLLKNMDFLRGNKIQEIRYAIYIAKQIQAQMPTNEFQVAAHNDLFARNLIDAGEKIWLVDWEYAGWESPYNDLASLIMEDELNSEQEKLVLDTYFENISPQEYKNFKFVCALYSLQSSIWSFSQLENNKNSPNKDIFLKAITQHFKNFWKNINVLKSELATGQATYDISQPSRI